MKTFTYKGRSIQIRRAQGIYSAWVKDDLDSWQLAQDGFRSLAGAQKAGCYGAIVLNAFYAGKAIPSYLEVRDLILSEFVSENQSAGATALKQQRIKHESTTIQSSNN